PEVLGKSSVGNGDGNSHYYFVLSIRTIELRWNRGEISVAGALHSIAPGPRLNRFQSQVCCAILIGATNTYSKVTLNWCQASGRKPGPVENEPNMSHEHLVTIGSDPKEQEDRKLRERMARIRRRLVVVSGKGGVGKC
ncbi:MAG TPA: hypothetical protein VMS37_23295, partial [Verrucomicrobiae bacterium]|nr:hypothetical protein [Verrucomicrobiae bacterium]